MPQVHCITRLCPLYANSKRQAVLRTPFPSSSNLFSALCGCRCGKLGTSVCIGLRFEGGKVLSLRATLHDLVQPRQTRSTCTVYCPGANVAGPTSPRRRKLSPGCFRSRLLHLLIAHHAQRPSVHNRSSSESCRAIPVRGFPRHFQAAPSAGKDVPLRMLSASSARTRPDSTSLPHRMVLVKRRCAPRAPDRAGYLHVRKIKLAAADNQRRAGVPMPCSSVLQGVG